MVVPHIADLMGEQPSAELTEEPSIAVVRTMVAYTVPITGPVPLRQVSRSGRLPVQRRHRVIAHMGSCESSQGLGLRPVWFSELPEIGFAEFPGLGLRKSVEF